MKRAIVTITCGDFHRRMAAITHPTIAAYARKLGADFIVWTDTAGHTLPHYQKFELGKLLDQYDRVLYLDTDILVRDDAPDIFAIVPEDQLGMADEGRYFDDHSRVKAMLNLLKLLGYDARDWNGKYYNAGVIVLSQAHREIFSPSDVEPDSYKEQTYLNLRIMLHKAKVFPLPHKFNRFFGMTSAYGDQRVDSYMLHYAGANLAMTDEALLKLMQDDLAVWKAIAPDSHLQRFIAFVVEGDLGQQVAAEPVLRYAAEVGFKQDSIVLVCPHPALFAHLNLPSYGALAEVPEWTRYRACRTLFDPFDARPAHIAREHVNPVNFASLAALGIELPMRYRTPRLPVVAGAAAGLVERTEGVPLDSLVLLHPASAKRADTFPASTWRSYADALIERGHRVAIIGDRGQGECPIVDMDAAGCLDLSDKLSVAELIALIQQARVLVAGDSPPIHFAGAFGNWIGLVAPSRDPEHVLPWRRGVQHWQAAVLQRFARYNRPFDDLWEAWGENQRFHDATEALPTPETVVDFVERALHTSPE